MSYDAKTCVAQVVVGQASNGEVRSSIPGKCIIFLEKEKCFDRESNRTRTTAEPTNHQSKHDRIMASSNTAYRTQIPIRLLTTEPRHGRTMT